MLKNSADSEMLVLFIFSELPDEVTLSEAREILLASEELDNMQIDSFISELEKSKQIYIGTDTVSDAKKIPGEKYVAITGLGAAIAETLGEQKKIFRTAINKAIRRYKKIACGIDYRIDIATVSGGSNVKFDVLVNGKIYFTSTMFFAKSAEALRVYNRIDNDPEAFYNGVMTVATGEIDYIM